MTATRSTAEFPRTWFVLGVLAVSTVTAMLAARPFTGDLDFFIGISRQLTTSHGAFIYADNPNAQSGPVSLLAIRGIDVIGTGMFPVVIGGLAIITFIILSRTRTPIGGLDLRLLAGGFIVALWWPYLKTAGHLDDALVLTLATLCLFLILRGRPVLAAVVIGVVIAVKPWAVFLIPMVMTRQDLRDRRFAAPLTAVLVAGALWSPFFLASTRTLDGLRPTVRLAPDSVLRLFGADSADLPSALRILQLGLALVAVAVVVIWRGRPAGALLAGVAVRLAFDPGTWNYYTVGFLLGALTWDLSRGQRLPVVTLFACVLLPPIWPIDLPEVRAIMRLVACACALTIVLWPDDAPSELEALPATRREPATAV